ncbi:IS3 family transposase, partial [Rossellomorea aquimaris]
MKGEGKRQLREESDELEVELIQYIFRQKNSKAGALSIKMHLENDYSVIMNHKKIRRL